MMNPEQKRRAKELRRAMTESERLLWTVLRAEQLCGLKFRREHFFEGYYLDFACIPKRLGVEIDGGVHDYKVEYDAARQQFLENAGWRVLRFSADDVVRDVEVVLRGIAAACELPYEYKRRMNPNHPMMRRFKPK